MNRSCTEICCCAIPIYLYILPQNLVDCANIVEKPGNKNPCDKSCLRCNYHRHFFSVVCLWLRNVLWELINSYQENFPLILLWIKVYLINIKIISGVNKTFFKFNNLNTNTYISVSRGLQKSEHCKKSKKYFWSCWIFVTMQLLQEWRHSTIVPLWIPGLRQYYFIINSMWELTHEVLWCSTQLKSSFSIITYGFQEGISFSPMQRSI